jgi:hypothetical protein
MSGLTQVRLGRLGHESTRRLDRVSPIVFFADLLLNPNQFSHHINWVLSQPVEPSLIIVVAISMTLYNYILFNVLKAKATLSNASQMNNVHDKIINRLMG